MSDQRYVSRELTHFVGSGKPEEYQYSLLVNILKSGWLTHPPHDPNRPSQVTKNLSAQFSAGQMYSVDAVCFCDIPLADLALHIRKYSAFGLAFTKTFLADKGANPVFYVANNSVVDIGYSALFGYPFHSREAGLECKFEPLVTRADFFDKVMHEYNNVDYELYDKLENSTPPVASELGELLLQSRFIHAEMRKQVFGFFKPFDASKDDDDRHNYYMEREWRVLGNIKFTIEDVCRVILPPRFAKNFRKDVPEYFGQITFP